MAGKATSHTTSPFSPLEALSSTDFNLDIFIRLHNGCSNVRISSSWRFSISLNRLHIESSNDDGDDLMVSSMERPKSPSSPLTFLAKMAWALKTSSADDGRELGLNGWECKNLVLFLHRLNKLRLCHHVQFFNFFLAAQRHGEDRELHLFDLYKV